MSSRNAATPNDRSAKKLAYENIGMWYDLLVEDTHGVEGNSVLNLLLKRQFKAAAEGNLTAIRQLLKYAVQLLKARLERERYPLIDERAARRASQEPTNADLAMVILGIASFDNKALASTAGADGEIADSRFASLRPNVLEDWVVDFARHRAGTNDSGEHSANVDSNHLVAAGRHNVSEWDGNRENLLARLMRLRGPGASRFKAGVSGNRRGRPRKQPPLHPHEDFLLAPLTKTIRGKPMTLTRLDMLLHSLSMMALKDQKIATLLLRHAMPLHEAGWEHANAIPLEPIKG
ncbi:DUF5681 domain-containing protein [Novosphingobium sp. PS1R-30]|uniref:DUF5681 domain-containing protein n=1 Tax=Novosphingobium anseongense TaxID=3133436 RepID=A0ABU8S1J5_9SPHN